MLQGVEHSRLIQDGVLPLTSPYNAELLLPSSFPPPPPIVLALRGTQR